MLPQKLILTTLFLLSGFFHSLYSQKVGLVLSGGGANGVAHLGVIQALEENNIPIDFITGTSSGAFVGAMYASGYSVEEIKAFLTSDEFIAMTRGDLNASEQYFFKKDDPSAAMFTVKVSKDFSLSNSLPTNVISTSKVDFEMMRIFSKASAAARYDFDSLLIPFRCVAADIDAKEEFVFAFGNLSTAVRASFTYPFLIKPIEVDGKLLYDGGLYNNFPHDIMTNEFKPDYIIGVKVTSNEPPPKSDDLISQVRTMLISKTDFNLKSPGLIIEPQTGQGSFDFGNIEEVIEIGYQEALKQIPAIREKVNRSINAAEREQKRKEFVKDQKDLVYGDLYIHNLKKRQRKYVKNNLWPTKDTSMNLNEIKKGFYRTSADPHIDAIFPSSAYDSRSEKYRLHVKVNKSKPFEFDFGGVISSRPISTGYVGLTYLPFSNPSYMLKANTYFGKFYNSVLVSGEIDFAWRIPFSVEISFIRNSWNYFKSHSFFFDDEKPSYLIKRETFGSLELKLPIGNNAKVTLLGNLTELRDNYYQTQNFGSNDVPDETKTNPITTGIKYEFNTQNRILYPNSGTKIALKGFYSQGEERTIPGTTAQDATISLKDHHWTKAQLYLDWYYKQHGLIRLGLTGDFVYSDQSLFNNYTASILRSPSYEPIPESQTLFLESFRAYKYISAGHRIVFNVLRNIDLRAEAFVFAPYDRVIKDNTGVQMRQKGFKDYFSILSSGLVYNSPVGPLSLSLNYYYNAPEINPENNDLSFLFHFGYILFNKKSLN
ncbi:MAG: hypothetical protein CL840_22230 [Crocinitomicaceae bacterium]|nr:hypothetical protein [Crocinitomicaceae bacterium]